ncbi:uncharacterized protein LOC110654006 isoform X2 [Hevea brasiliensis]|uniref:uncharacterized protein LOC110654006 isoform X2 n=1 Tax=Hevea brasiliensis TaxID=3981 RepID=UPI0025FD988B|nr:uncharacterized protein LOC110654006 isoform X2 [Hevea brasiliensis]
MDSSWQVKCGSTFPSSMPAMASSTSQEPRDQMEINSGHSVYSHVGQDWRSQIHGRMLDPAFANISNLSSCSMSNTTVGSSFLALLSGPAALLQFDFQELSNPRLLNTSNKLPIEIGSVTISPAGSQVPQSSGALLSDDGNYQNMQNGVDLCSIVSSRAVANSISGSSSVFQNGLPAENISTHGLDLPKTVVHHADLGNEKIKDFPSLRGEWCSTPIANALKLQSVNNQIPQKLPLEAEYSAYNKSSTSSRGCPRVFCLDRSGDLLLSNTGLLGILCSCHCFHMSVSKFCEHSGLWNLNPGDAVRMDSGETIAQWRRVYFQKFGIRVPEDQSGWDWPEGLSLTASLVKSGVPISNMPKNSDCSNLVVPSGGLVRSGQPLGDVFPKNFLAEQNSVVDALCDKQQRNGQDGNLFYLRGLVATSQNSSSGVEDNHVTDCFISRCSTAPKFTGRGPENVCKSTYIDSIGNSASLATAHRTLQNHRNLVKNSDVSSGKGAWVGAIMDKDASSSMELKLGQPYQQNQSSGNSVLPVIGQQFHNTLVNSQKPFPQEQMIHNVTSFRGEKESRLFSNRAIGPSNSTARREQDHLGYGSCVINNAMDGGKVEKLRGNIAKTSGVSLFKHYSIPEGSSNSKATNNLLNLREHVIPEMQHCESHFVNCEPIIVPWNGGNGLDKQYMLPDLGCLKSADKGKGVGCLAGNSYTETASGSKMHKWMENPSSFTGAVSGNGCSTVPVMHNKNRYSHHLSNVPTDVSAGKFSNCLEKVPCFGKSGHIDQLLLRSRGSPTDSRQILSSRAVPIGSPSSTPTSIPGLTPATLNHESIGISPHLLEDNLRLLALGQILELSKQHTLSALGKNLEQGKCSNSSVKVQHSFVEPSTSEEQRHVPNLNRKQDVSEVAMKSDQSGPTSKMVNDVDKFASVTGLNRWCNFSTLTQGLPLQCKEIGKQCQLSYNTLQNEQSSLRLGKSQNNITLSNEHDNCCQRTLYFQYNCGCAAHTCIGGKCNFSGNSSNSLREQTESLSCKTPMLVASQFAKDYIVPKENSISFGQCETLKGQLSKNISCNASQWKDVPSKVKRVCEVASVRRPSDALDERGPEDGAAKCSHGAVHTADSSKDQDMSNISSGCSTPAVTQASIEVTNVDSSTVVGNTGYVDNLIVDEGSGIDKCWSSDDAFESDRSTDFYGHNCKTNERKEGSCKGSGNKSSRSLLDEVKLMDSLTWKKSQSQNHSGLTVCGKTNPSHESGRGLKNGKRKREMKLKVLDASLHTAPPVVQDKYPECDVDWPCLSNNMLMISSGPESSRTCGAHSVKINTKHGNSTLPVTKAPSHKRDLRRLYNARDRENDHDREMNCSDNSCKILKISDRKKFRSTQTADMCMQFQMQESTPAVGEQNLKYESVNYLKASSSWQVNLCCRKAKPVVCGNYGEIVNGNMTGDVTKSYKIVSLDKILKTARRCSLPKNCKPGLTSSREWKSANFSWSNACFDKLSKLKKEKENWSNDDLESEEMNIHSPLEERDVAFASGDEQSADEFSVLEKREDKSRKVHVILDNANGQSKTKYKETRKRSIYELTLKGMNPSPKMVSQNKIFKCKPKIKLQQILKNSDKNHIHGSRKVDAKRYVREQKHLSITDINSLCCVCGSSNKDDVNCLLECGRCSIRVHQACYGVSKVPKGHWYCRPCRTSSKNIVCVLCGYGGGAMTRALRSRTIVKSLLKVWNLDTECRPKNAISSAETMQDGLNLFYSSESVPENSSYPVLRPLKIEPSASTIYSIDVHKKLDILQKSLCCISDLKVHNSITAGVLDSTVKQWVHMVCGLWTPGTRCPNVDTMSAFDVSGASHPRANVVCSMCNRPGGSCIQCRDVNCSVQFHPWCAHQKGLLQSEAEGIDNENVGFYGRCVIHATGLANESACDAANIEAGYTGEKEASCARTEGYKGRKRDGFWHDINSQSNGRGGCLVPQEQVNAWVYINGQKSCAQGLSKLPISEKEYDCRKEYARYKQAKGWKHLVVYKSGIHALGLYTSRFISRGG